MMIRINLLPTRQVQKREAGRQILVVLAGAIVATVAANYVWYENRAAESDRRKREIAETRRRIEELEKIIGEVNNINKRKKEVEEKLKTLSDLRKGRSGPVRMLDALALATPKKVWLKEFTEMSNQVKLDGFAFSHEDVAEFMRGLSGMVWTPRGMGRLVERRRDAKTARIELYASEGGIEEFAVAEVGSFFTNIDLKRAEADSKKVTFEITLTANYAI